MKTDEAITDQDPIIVLGTGRSGTSMVAGMLNYLGVHMGEEFIDADMNNPTGHWEDKEFTELSRNFVNDRIDKDEWLEELKMLIQRRADEADGGAWGWKIPVSSNIVDKYQKLTPNARYLIARRDPEDSIQSCIEAYSWSKTRAENLIGTRVKKINEEIDPNAENVHIVDFEELIKDKHEVADGVLEWINETGAGVDTGEDKDRTELIEESTLFINQIEKEAKVMLAIPNLGDINHQLAKRTNQWLMTREGGELAIWYPSKIVPHDNARNMIVKSFLEDNPDFTHLFMVDADTIPPKHALDALLKANRPVVSGCTPTMKYDQYDAEIKKQFMVMNQGIDDHGEEGVISTWGKGVEEVDFVGSSCLMIQRHVLEELDPPYFKFQYDEDGLRVRGEDFNFCDNCHDAGIDIYADFNVVCKHSKEIIL